MSDHITNDEYRADIKKIAGSVDQILATLGLLNSAGEFQVSGRELSRAVTSILSDMTRPNKTSRWEFLKEIIPLLDKYKFLIDEYKQDRKNESGKTGTN